VRVVIIKSVHFIDCTASKTLFLLLLQCRLLVRHGYGNSTPLITLRMLSIMPIAKERRFGSVGPAGRTTMYLKTAGTGTIATHLKDKHRIKKPTIEDLDEDDASNSQQTNSSRPNSIAVVFRQLTDASSSPRPRKRPRISKLEDVDRDALLELIQDFIIECTLPFRVVEKASFRALIDYCNPHAEVLIPQSHNTISKSLMDRYNGKKGRIRALLQTATSRIHISCDNWTCGNAGKAYIGITARFVNKEGRQQLVLAMKELPISHSGENMAGVFLEVSEDFEITSLIGFCNCDNAYNNDTMTAAIEEAMIANGYVWSAKLNRLRCVGHISNLAVQALLHGKHPHIDLDPDVPSLDDMASWRKEDTLYTAHSLILWTYKSPQRRKAFLLLSEGTNLIRDNNTRWTSWYDTIERLLGLEDAVGLWQLAIDKDKKVKSRERPKYLVTEDWELLRIYLGFLRPYREATLATEGYNDGLNKVLIGMDMLLDHLEKGKEDYAEHDFFRTSIETSWSVLIKYYELTDESAAYTTAIVMDPRWKWHYFDKFWKNNVSLEPYIERAKKGVSLSPLHLHS
jgi:hypothetical protein